MNDHNRITAELLNIIINIYSEMVILKLQTQEFSPVMLTKRWKN